LHHHSIFEPYPRNLQLTPASLSAFLRLFLLFFSALPVVERETGNLVGLLTKNDFDLCDDHQKPATEVMTPAGELITGEPGTTIQQAYQKMQSTHKKVLPLVKDGKIVGMYLASDIQRVVGKGSKIYNLDKKGRLYVGAAVGVGESAIERAVKLEQAGVDVVVIDTAHFDTPLGKETFERIKDEVKIDVVIGNISERESAIRALKLGADGIKVGQGPGSICTTRMVAGIGCPQVTAIYNCWDVAHHYDCPISADGGIRYQGDVPIAIGAGADSVMVGRVLAGTTEAPGRTIEENGVRFKAYRGMGSKSAMDDSAESRNRYGAEGLLDDERVPEGIETKVLLVGSTKEVLASYIGGLRKGMFYVGAENIQQLKEKARFWRITGAGKVESTPHVTSFQSEK